MIEPKVAATLISMKLVNELNPEVAFAREMYTPEQFGQFVRELRRLQNIAFDFHEFDLTPEEVKNLVQQGTGKLH